MNRDIDAPSGGQADVLFYGLVAFIPQGSYLDAAFLDAKVFTGMAMDEHEPFLVVDVGALSEGKTSADPDYLIPAEGGHGLGVWTFEKIQFDNAAGGLNLHDDPITNPGNDKYTRMGWIPSMHEIFGTNQQVDPNNLSKVASTAELRAGTVYAVFDVDEHKTETWTIGDRKNTPVADGVRLRIDLDDAGLPLKLVLDGGARVVYLKGGNSCILGCYPKTPPKRGDDLKHFPHLYYLRQGGDDGQHDPRGPGGTTPYPARCTPVKFP